MVQYNPPIRDYNFLLHEVFNVIEMNQRLGYEGFDRDTIDMMIEEWADLMQTTWLPSNVDGDRIGSTFTNGKVTTPPSFKTAWNAAVEGGWFATVAKAEHGGLEAPLFLRNAMDEFAISSNMALSTIGALSLGVYELISEHAEQKLIDMYAEKVALGEWCGTMCLTEPHAGTDLGIINSKAEPQNDGSYKISGTKIFITFAEHDLSENIVHMVLAKLPNSPEGTHGISLFLVPKYLSQDGLLSEQVNGVTCSGIEEKMGLHGSPTCVLNFDESIGWLVGEENCGMKLMFEMMNRERLATGMMGIGLGEVAYQNSLQWCKERRQGRDLKGTKDMHESADSILVHPDVRRMLLKVKANNEGSRALGTWVGTLLDELQRGDSEGKVHAEALVSLLTPIIKAHATDLGCESTSLCIQVMGGAGYCTEYGVEQFYRDVRIAPIWEGTNGIQSLDLAGRKITKNFGKNLRHLMWPLLEFIEENRDDARMSKYTKPLYQNVKGLQQLTLLMISEGMGNPHFLAGSATDYTSYFGNTMLAFMWAKMAGVCIEAQKAGVQDDFYKAKLALADVFFNEILPDNIGLAAKVQSGHKHLMEYPEVLL
ncbi:MAG: acyl-CoA dehydrogenase [Euryarchaeota archaeon]|nr:acyl-CoA dehydrogenase [Euryarchaeota archaeon]